MQKKYNRLTKIKNLNYKKREKRNKWKKKGKKKVGWEGKLQRTAKAQYRGRGL